jgi:phospholipase C
VDLRRGQNFIAEIFNDLLADLPQRDHMLFIITYDEHGGFYDHVPPPGTDLGPAEWKGRVPRIHPQGADNMGVRVPAIVVSPWVSAGSVCKEVFDHTSIIKTILLHQRTHFSADDFTQFGPRVNQANHVGLALDLDTARTDWPAEITRMGRRPSERVNPGQRPSQGAHLNDLHETLRRVFLPRPA